MCSLGNAFLLTFSIASSPASLIHSGHDGTALAKESAPRGRTAIEDGTYTGEVHVVALLDRNVDTFFIIRVDHVPAGAVGCRAIFLGGVTLPASGRGECTSKLSRTCSVNG